MAKKIYNNTTRHVIIFGKTVLLPGANASEEIDAKKFPNFKSMVDCGCVVVIENAADAVAKANTQAAVDAILKTDPKDEKVKEAAAKRKKQLNELDKEAERASLLSKLEV